MAVPQTIATGVANGEGCAYLPGKNQLLFVEWDPPQGRISAVDLATNSSHVLGTGYGFPLGIAVSSNGAYAYVTQYDIQAGGSSGELVRVDLAHPDHAQSTVVSSTMDIPLGIVLDEARGMAYVVENAGQGRLLRINLATGGKVELCRGLEASCGLLVTSDRAFAYVAERGYPPAGRLTRIDLTTGQRQTVVSGLTQPNFLAWAGPSQAALYVTEGYTAHRLTQVDLTHTPPVVTQIATLPSDPEGIALSGPGRVLVCCQHEIDLLDLDADDFNAGSPLLMGIGHVPASHIVGGYGNTDPGAPIYAVDSPFGGTLRVMINHQAARDRGAAFYRVKVDGVIQRDTFWDYLWDAGLMYDVWTPTAPQGDGFYPVRQAGQLWHEYWLGHWTNSTLVANGLHTLTVELYTAANPGNLIPGAPGTASLVLKIDNTWPTAVIEKIFHYKETHVAPAPPHFDWEEVPKCAVVQDETDQFTFQITANDPQGHLKSWELWAWWGDNGSELITSEQYTPVPNHMWTGPTSHEVPPRAAPWHARKAGDTSSYRCAHTFYLAVWDRVIDGEDYLHYSAYHKSITILLPHPLIHAEPVHGHVTP